MAFILDQKAVICLQKIFLPWKSAIFVPIPTLQNSILQNVKFAKEGGLKSKSARKQTCLRIKNYRKKSVSEIKIWNQLQEAKSIPFKLINPSFEILSVNPLVFLLWIPRNAILIGFHLHAQFRIIQILDLNTWTKETRGPEGGRARMPMLCWHSRVLLEPPDMNTFSMDVFMSKPSRNFPMSS